MKISAAKADGFINNPGNDILAVLVYGPDNGLVRERAKALLSPVIDGNFSDPFRYIELAGDVIAEDPPRLADEAAAFSMTGGRRGIYIREASDKVNEAVRSFFQNPSGDSLIVIEAGDLSPRSTLRKFFESAKNAAAVPCYLSEGRDQIAFIRHLLDGFQIKIEPDAMIFLSHHLGADRGITRNEISKLALYASDQAIDLETVRMALADNSAMTMDDMAHAVAGGNLPLLDRLLNRVFSDGTNPASVLRWVSMHFQKLHLAGGHIDSGLPPGKAMATIKPPIFFKFKDAFLDELRRWPTSRSLSALDHLLTAELECKSSGLPTETICRRALASLAYKANSRT